MSRTPISPRALASLVPMTAAGVFAAALAIFGLVAGWQLGWIELVVLGTGAAAAVLLAIPFVVGGLRLETTRSMPSRRTTVGEPITVDLTVTNLRAAATRARTITDRVGDTEHRLRLPRLAGGATVDLGYRLATLPRGRYQIGPLVISRSDPLRLMLREVEHSDHDVIWVHPRYEPITALPVGFAKDLEGPTSDTSPIGDVAFHSLREYQPGDDFRHIHWMSTARLDQPMVRHYVDNRRPHLAVLLDDRPEAMEPAQFEVAVEVAASIGVSSLLHHEPSTVWTTAGPLLGRGAAASIDDVLDELSGIRQRGQGALDEIAQQMTRADRTISAVVLVTGSLDPTTLLLFVARLKRYVRVIVVRSWPHGNHRVDALPGARLLDVDSLAAFVVRWQGVAR